MIDTAFIKQRMRDANPVPGADNIDAEELSRAVAAAQTRLAATPQAPTQHETLEPLRPMPRPRRARKAWAFAAAFALIVASIGATALLLRADNTPVADEPVASTSAATPDNVTAGPLYPPVDDSYGDWEWMVVDEPWAASVVDVASLPAGGFVVAAESVERNVVRWPGGSEWVVETPTEEWSVLWSRDGMEWRDGDPQREVTVLPRGQVVTTLDDRVVVLDSYLFGIRIGDLEAQSWNSIQFETSDFDGEIGLLAAASNETDVLVVGYEDDYGDGGPAECGETQLVPEKSRYLAWLVDPRSGAVQSSMIPDTGGVEASVGARVCGDPASVAWFKGQWVISLDGDRFVSTDGSTWTPNPVPRFAGKITLMAGRDILFAEACGMVMECILYRSDNGIDWTVVPEPDEFSEPKQRRPADATAYSEAFGYVATPWSDPGVYVSDDGRNWQYLAQWPDVDRLTASGERAFGVGEFGKAYLLIYSESPE